MRADTGQRAQGPLSESILRDLISRHVPEERIPKKITVKTDTTDFFRIDYDDVLVLAGTPYLMRNHEHEGRFGIEEQPKFWVKRAIDLLQGDTKIIKMVFHERFRARVGGLDFDCFRSPAKEARILELVGSEASFMHGFGVDDGAGNMVRVIDYILGMPLSETIENLSLNHEDYFYNEFPKLLDDFVELVRAIQFLHMHGQKHGDIRRDHIIRDRRNGKCRWIDFDFDYIHRENRFGYDIFGLGNILIYLAGGGDVTSQGLLADNNPVVHGLSSDDMNIIFPNRVANLGKIYPYLPAMLNSILLRFAGGAEMFYDLTVQFLDDLREARETLYSGKEQGGSHEDEKCGELRKQGFRYAEGPSYSGRTG